MSPEYADDSTGLCSGNPLLAPFADRLQFLCYICSCLFEPIRMLCLCPFSLLYHTYQESLRSRFWSLISIACLILSHRLTINTEGMQQAESKFGLLTTQSNMPKPNCNSNFYNNTRGLEGVLGAVPDDFNRENALKTPPLDVEERSKQPACNISLCYESVIQRECKFSQQNQPRRFPGDYICVAPWECACDLGQHRHRMPCAGRDCGGLMPAGLVGISEAMGYPT